MAATAVRTSPRRPVSGHLALAQGDDRLVARVRAGDDAAFEAIYDRYARGLLAFCGHMLGSRDEAEDVLQHSFVSAYRALRDSDSDIALRPWLYTIARNRCLSELRSRRETVDEPDENERAHSLDGLPAEVQRRAELRDLVEDMRRLPPDQRAALVLFELGDHSHRDIAAVLGVRTEKVKALVFQARETLLRTRQARETPCAEVREQIAMRTGRLSRRSALRAHLEGCAACSAFEAEVRRQRTALAAILPIAPSAGLKAAVLGSAIPGGGAIAAAGGAGAAGGGSAALGGAAGAAGGAGAGGTATVATAGAGTIGMTGGIGAAGAGTIAGGAGAAAGATTVATGLAGAGTVAAGGLAGLSAKGVVAKILTVVAVTTGAVDIHHQSKPTPQPSHSASSAPQVSSATPQPIGPPAVAAPIVPTATPATTGAQTPTAATTAPAATHSTDTAATTSAPATGTEATSTTTASTPPDSTATTAPASGGAASSSDTATSSTSPPTSTSDQPASQPSSATTSTSSGPSPDPAPSNDTSTTPSSTPAPDPGTDSTATGTTPAPAPDPGPSGSGQSSAPDQPASSGQ